MPVLQTPGVRALEKVPGRALKLLTGSSRNLEIKALLLEGGFDQAARQVGWERLFAVVNAGEATPPPVVYDPEVVEAMKALDRFDNHHVPVVDVTLRYNFPDAHDTVFAGGLTAAEGAESVVVVRTLLDRVDRLSADAQALLAKRGLTPAVRAQARRWLARVEGVDVAGLAVDAEGEVVEEDDEVDDGGEAGPVGRAWHEASVALWRWLDEWSTIARRHVTRRDQLIQIGLAHRKAPVVTPPVPG